MSCKTLQYRYKTYAYKREAEETATPTTFMRKAGLQLVVQPLRYNYRYLNQKELESCFIFSLSLLHSKFSRVIL